MIDYPHYLRRSLDGPLFAPSLYTRQMYHNTVLTVTARNPARVDAATTAAYRAVVRVVTGGVPVGRAGFALYLEGRTLMWVKAACGPADLRGRSFLMRVFPGDVVDLPRRRRQWGFEGMSFDFGRYGVRVDGGCLLRLPLPAYPIRAIEASQVAPSTGTDLWRVAIPVSPPGASTTDLVRTAYRAAVAGPFVARSHFAVYLAGTTLTYLRAPCRRADTVPGFFLHVRPRDPAVLAGPRGFEVLDFAFRRHQRDAPQVQQAAYFAGTCLGSIRLPVYPIAELRTGQGRGAERVWEVAVRVEARAASGGPEAVE